jgi:zinc/manganese transport system substrate-binding protein
MRSILRTLSGVTVLVSLAASPIQARVKVVATTTTYASLAEEIGGDAVEVFSIASADQDVHFVRPKPSFAPKLARADLLLTTGMDLELWLPTLIDKAGNARVREGQVGYVAVADGIPKLEIPETGDRSRGGVHLYGNPHLVTSPLNVRKMAENITIGLVKVDPGNRAHYEARLGTFRARLDAALFGEELVRLIGAPTLLRLAASGNLISFLERRKIKGRPMLALLGGWMKRALPLRGRKIVTYHKNWVYFAKVFGLEIVGEIEPKPAIPPSPKHVERVINLMRSLDVRVVLAASYFDESKVHRICAAVDARAVIAPLYVGGAEGTEDYFRLVDHWLDGLLDAYGVVK